MYVYSVLLDPCNINKYKLFKIIYSVYLMYIYSVLLDPCNINKNKKITRGNKHYPTH